MTRRTKILVKLGVTVAALSAALWNVGVGPALEKLRLLDATAWLIAFVAFILVHGCGTFKWRLFMRLCGARLALVDGFRCYGAGLFANLCLPSVIGGDVLRAGLAMTASRQKTAVVLGSLLDRCADFVSLCVLAIVGFVMAWGPASARLTSQAGGTDWKPLVIAGSLGAAGILAAAIAWRTWRPKGRIRRLVLEILVAARRLRRHFLVGLGGMLVSLSLQFTLLLVQRELGVRMGMPRDFAVWLFIWPVAKLVAMVPISIGGLGVREKAWRDLAEPFGIAAKDAVSTSLAWQAVLLVGGLLGGAVWLLLTWRPSARLEPAESQAT